MSRIEVSEPPHQQLRDYFLRYARASFRIEPVYVAVCEAIADNEAVLDILAEHSRPAQQPNLIMAAVRWLTDETDHPLTTSWQGPQASEAPRLFCEFVVANRSEVDAILATRTTQTNETGRCSALALFLAEVHRRSALPLAWIDLGASAGLNLRLDRYCVDYACGDEVVSTGSATAPLRIECEVLGGRPDVAAEFAPIAWRVGVDRAPIDPTVEAEARWLKACVWPNDARRANRLSRALAVAADRPVDMIRGDAADGLSEALAAAPPAAQLVVTTSWVWYYLPDDTREAVLEVLRGSKRRVMWASLEGRGVVPGAEHEHPPPSGRSDESAALGLMGLGGGEPDEIESLGWAHNHGNWVDWRPRSRSGP